MQERRAAARRLSARRGWDPTLEAFAARKRAGEHDACNVGGSAAVGRSVGCAASSPSGRRRQAEEKAYADGRHRQRVRMRDEARPEGGMDG